MVQQRELPPMASKFVNDWIDLVNANPTATLGDWVYVFGACAALAMKSQDLTPEQFEDAVHYLNEAVRLVYRNTETTFRANLVQ